VLNFNTYKRKNSIKQMNLNPKNVSASLALIKLTVSSLIATAATGAACP
jgi:hypothetical protein